MRLFPVLILLACETEEKPLVDEPIPDELRDQDNDGYTSEDGDCDDQNDLIYPGGDEICDGVDNNCDEQIDEDVMLTFYLDQDNDGFGDPNETLLACEIAEGYVSNGSDCNDQEPTAHPGAEEICDGLDNDCNEEIDEDVQGTFFIDADGDGFGDPDQPLEQCIQDVGLSEVSGDCNDTDPAISPVAYDICDGVDNNCDGAIDEDVQLTFYLDADEDGFGDPNSTTLSCEEPEGYTSNNLDCDDIEPEVNPIADEYCDGVDNDCDGTSDESGAIDALIWYADSDNDGFGDVSVTAVACNQPTGYVGDSSDCDDATSSTNPNADEYCNGVDDNCDGTIDEDNAINSTTYYTDNDGDGFGNAASTIDACSQPNGYVLDSTDCNDNNNSIYVGADETCNTLDDDCDGTVDEEAIDFISYYIDSDGDGFGEDSSLTESCTLPNNASLLGGDCDDSSNAAHPNGIEVCDGLDNNCDGSTDDGSSIDALMWFEDADLDGYGNASISMLACNQPQGYCDNDDDCDDSDAQISPVSTELENSLDDDCDGYTDEGTNAYDDDGDGFSENDGDCNDLDSSINPTATEFENGIDDNCDGYTDEGTNVYDDDGDGYSENDGDCDDGDSSIYPSANELENGIDDDCDGYTDEGTNAYDDDGDGYSENDGDCDDADSNLNLDDVDADGFSTCDNDCDDQDPSLNLDDVDGDGYSTCDGDCDDADFSLNLDDDDGDGDSTCAGDCDDADGSVNTNDADNDGYTSCDGDCDDADGSLNLDDYDNDGESSCDGDCDDADASVYSSALELCDGFDNDCNGQVDDGAALGTGTNCVASGCGNITGVDGLYYVDVGNGTEELYCELTTDGGGWTMVYWNDHDHHNTSSSTNRSSLGDLDTHAKMSDSDIRNLAQIGAGEVMVKGHDSSTIYIERYNNWNYFSSTGWANQNFDSKDSNGNWQSGCNGHYNNRGISTYSDNNSGACQYVYSGSSKYFVTYHTHMYAGGLGGEFGVYVR
jgi:hypothetical protein